MWFSASPAPRTGSPHPADAPDPADPALDDWLDGPWYDSAADPQTRSRWSAPRTVPLRARRARRARPRHADDAAHGGGIAHAGTYAAGTDAADAGDDAPPARQSRLQALLARLTLFWRTFFLIALLLAASLIAGIETTHMLGREVQMRRFTHEVLALAGAARAALEHVDPAQRAELIADLGEREPVRVRDAVPGEAVEPWPDAAFAASLARRLARPGDAPVRIASEVSGVPGFWIGLTVAGRALWMQTGLPYAGPAFDPAWMSVLTLAAALALLGALLISRLVNRPLSDLARAVDLLARGDTPQPLPSRGPPEIVELNHRFNLLAGELQANEAERALVLAGISHDIRTPLTRLRLEIEMSDLSGTEQRSMSDEIDRINAIVDQFIEYARPLQESDEQVDVADEILQFTRSHDREANDGRLQVECQIEQPLTWTGNVTVVHRILDNLVENASRYGRSPDGVARVEIAARRRGKYVHLVVRDHGAGVPAQALQWLDRPFARLDGERSASGGTGLGLAVISRLARRSGGDLLLDNAPDGGLIARVRLGERRHGRGGDTRLTTLLDTRFGAFADTRQGGHARDDAAGPVRADDASGAVR